MGALNALQRSPGALTRNPVLVLPVLLVGSFQLPQLVLQSTNPVLASLVSLGLSGLFVLVVPFFQGGIIGMADEALAGRTRLRTFVAAGKAHYVDVLVAYLLLLVANAVGVGILLVVGLVGGVFVLPHLALSGFALGFVGLAFGLFVLAFLLFAFFVQFYAQAIVLEDAKAVDGIRRSVGLVRRNPVSTLGYSVVGGVVGGLLGLGFAAISTMASPASAPLLELPRLSLPGVAAVSVVGFVVASIVGTVLAVFSVAFYRDISARP